MQPRKKVGVDPTRNYDELSPADLIESLILERAIIDQDEFSRAKWFWNRRPKVLFENLIFLFGYTIVFVWARVHAKAIGAAGGRLVTRRFDWGRPLNFKPTAR